MLFSKVKDMHGTRIKIFGFTLYELRKDKEENATYIFGLKVRSKRPKALIDCKIREEAEQKIWKLHEEFHKAAENEKIILCFDCLYDPLAEAIDAWTLFEYLQSQGIPSRYALLKSNPLYHKLAAENRLKDILLVDSEFDLLRNFPEEIARSKRIFFSFPFTCSRVLLELPHCPFIFIEHGVNLMKPWCIRLYTPGGDSECNYILTPSRLTRELYESMQIMQHRMLCCGLPRWDKLPPATPDKEQRNIFIFFTWRTTFIHDKRLLDTYINRVSDFLDQLHTLVADRPEISLHIGIHHALLLHNPRFDFSRLRHARIIPTNEISAIIKNTDLFITDYSSVCFDLMYRDIPTIFYRFDSDLSYSNPMDNEAALSAADKDSLLYNCCYNSRQALQLVQQYIHNNFAIEDELRRKNERIFWQRGDNCRKLIELSNNI